MINKLDLFRFIVLQAKNDICKKYPNEKILVLWDAAKEEFTTLPESRLADHEKVFGVLPIYATLVNGEVVKE